MPKSLDNGPSARIPVTVSATEKQALFDVLRDGETVSELTRELWRKEIAKRRKSSSQSN